MSTNSNLSAMLSSSVSTNNVCLNWNGKHLIATIDEDTVHQLMEIPLTWTPSDASGKAQKSECYLDKWDEYTSSVEDNGYTVGEIVNGKMNYLNHCYLVHSDNKSLKVDAQKTTRQVINLIAPYVGLQKFTVTSKTPNKRGEYLAWEWYGTTDSTIKQAFNSAISEINKGCCLATETLENAKKWTANRSVIDTQGKAYINKSNELVNALSELDKLKAELDKLKASKTSGKTSAGKTSGK